MEEKVLIKSKLDKKVVKVLMFQIFLYFFLGIISVPISFSGCIPGDFAGTIILLIIGGIFILLGIISIIICCCYTKCELTITEKNIKGKTGAK